MESVPSSPGEGEGVWRVYHHHLVRGGSVESVPSSPGEGECGECDIHVCTCYHMCSSVI